MELIDKVREVSADYLKNSGIELVDITYRREQGGMTLRLLVDTQHGIKIAQCEALNKYLSETLDKDDIMSERYVIEVSSPGLDRPITSDRDFERVIGKVLELTTYEPISERKTHEGKLIGSDKEKIVIEKDEDQIVIPRAKIARARLKIEF